MATKNSVIELALGRIFRLASRPTQPGDIADYERCRAIILGELETADAFKPYAPNYARDRAALAGAAGGWD